MISIIILAFIQGISEFLPISSSFHLIILRDLFFIGNDLLNNNIKLTFDVALHLGTVLSIIVYFFSELKSIFLKSKNGIKDKEGRILWLILFATIPGAIFGFLFDDLIESYFRTQFLIISFSLIFMGVLLYLIDNKMSQEKSIKEIGFKDAFIIGFSQVFALIPGFSRSGTTITSARFLKINRKDSAKFSFYLSIPIILGASLLQLIKSDFNIIVYYLDIFILGILISFTTGILCIKYLLKYLRNNDYKIFMWYRIIFGSIIIAYFLFN